MIVLPVWVEKDEPKGIWAVLGSEPSIEAVAEWIPREYICNCLYADLVPSTTEKKMAMILMSEDNLPDKIRSLLENKK
jgi:hypothetical protein